MIDLPEVKPGATIYYELWYRPGSTSVAGYAVDSSGNRKKISHAMISKARKAGKTMRKVVLVPYDYEIRRY